MDYGGRFCDSPKIAKDERYTASSKKQQQSNLKNVF
jgi:hypothetical protein